MGAGGGQWGMREDDDEDSGDDDGAWGWEC